MTRSLLTLLLALLILAGCPGEDPNLSSANAAVSGDDSGEFDEDACEAGYEAAEACWDANPEDEDACEEEDEAVDVARIVQDLGGLSPARTVILRAGGAEALRDEVARVEAQIREVRAQGHEVLLPVLVDEARAFFAQAHVIGGAAFRFGGPKVAHAKRRP